MTPTRLFAPLVVGGLALAGGAALSQSTGGAGDREPTWRDRQVQQLVLLENARRQETDFLTQAPSNRVLGPNPRDMVALPGDTWATALPGVDRIAVHTASGTVEQTLPGPSGVCALALAGDRLVAVGNLSDSLYVYARGSTPGEPWRTALRRAVPGAVSLVDVAAKGDSLVVADRARSALFVLSPEGELQRTVPLEQRPYTLAMTDRWMLVLSVLDHMITLFPLEGGPPQRIEHHGPIWSMATYRDGDVTWLALGGVEDHDLDRSRGFFGYIDSFVYLYRVVPGADPKRIWSANLSQRGVVTPKTLAFDTVDGRPELSLWGYGGFSMARITWNALPEDPQITLFPWPPGTQAAVRHQGWWITANPLLDAWVLATPLGYRIQPVPGPRERTPEERLGEALFFTELMAPYNTGEGPLSRFTCETCHFEGDGDGRVHFTGRHEIYASTKSLRGLFNNRPHFSRALDRTMAEMVNNEFRVANSGSEFTPWFALDTDAYPWLKSAFGISGMVDPVDLRRDFMSFLMIFSPDQNPYTLGRTRLTEQERTGAALFRRHCENCHQARTVTDDPDTRLPFEAWEAALLEGGGIVWAEDDYMKTGVVPFVHPRGTRVPSLRGVWKKSPLFTNGSARSLRQAVGTGPRHDGEGGLTPAEKEALTAFLKLL